MRDVLNIASLETSTTSRQRGSRLSLWMVRGLRKTTGTEVVACGQFHRKTVGNRTPPSVCLMDMSDPDHNLVARCLAGEEDGFAELFQRHQARSLRTALALVGNLTTAEEAIQEAFFRAFRTLHRKRANVSFATWLYRYVVWAARRQSSKSRRHSADPLEFQPSTTADLDRSELRLQLVAAIQELPIDFREVLVLRFYLDLSVEEVARILRCRQGTVKSRTSRALDQMAASGRLAGIDGANHSIGGQHVVPGT